MVTGISEGVSYRNCWVEQCAGVHLFSFADGYTGKVSSELVNPKNGEASQRIRGNGLVGVQREKRARGTCEVGVEWRGSSLIADGV